MARKSRTRIWRMGDPDGVEPKEHDGLSTSDSPSPKKKTLREMKSELSELAAMEQLGPDDRERIDQIVTEAASLASKGPEYRRLYERALQIQKKALKKAATPPRGQKQPGGPRFARNPGLSHGGREVLGGLPSSRRGH